MTTTNDQPANAQTEIREWFRKRADEEGTIDAPALTDEAVERFGDDVDFCRRYFMQTFRESVKDEMRRSMHEWRRRLRVAVRDGINYDARDLLSRYFVRLPAQGCHVRITEMSENDVATSDLTSGTKVGLIAAMPPGGSVSDVDPDYAVRMIADWERVDAVWYPGRESVVVGVYDGDARLSTVKTVPRPYAIQPIDNGLSVV